MKSPFAIFRKHEKIMMVILVGLSMIGFVLLGAINNAQDKMPPALILLVSTVVCGMAAWIAGMPSGHSKDYGGWGLVGGALVAVLIINFSKPAAAIQTDFGNLSHDDLLNLQRRREIANKFVAEAIRSTSAPDDPSLQQRLANAQFRFTANPTSPRDVILGEILRHEARRAGLVANDEGVTQFVQRITSDRMTTKQFNEIRSDLKLSENQLYDILRDELQARIAAEMLYAPAATVTPEKYWEFYRQIYVKESGEVAAVPVKDFIDDSAEPSQEELNDIFKLYRENYPNQTKEGRLEEGRPGLYQPRRAKLAFFEATFDDAVSGIDPVTEAEIEAYFKEHYLSKPGGPGQPTPGAGADSSESPEVLNAEPPQSGPSLPEPKPEAPEPKTTPETNGNQPDAAPKPSDGAAPASESDSPPGETPKSPEPNAGDRAEPGTKGSTPEQEPGCADDPAPTPADDGTPPPAETKEPGSTDAPASAESGETPPAKDDQTPPAAEITAPAAGETESPGTTTPGTEEPPLPQPLEPVLDDKMKDSIRSLLVDERVAEKLKARMQLAADYVQDDIGRAFVAPEKGQQPMTVERAAQLAADHAANDHLHYGETPFLSSLELAEQNEDYPVGMAISTTPGREDFVAQSIFATGDRDLYRPIVARNDATKSWFACWKVAEQASYAPESLSEERVRGQAVAIWRELQAREKAETRARDLAELVRKSEEPMSKVLSDQKITGAESSLYLKVEQTGQFHYRGIPNALDPNPLTFYGREPRILSPNGVENAGPEFMETVFNELSPGDVGVAANIDKSTFYVVKVLTRSQATPEERELFRERFMREPLFGHQFGESFLRSVYQTLAVIDLQQNLLNWQEELLQAHNVRLSVGMEK